MNCRPELLSIKDLILYTNNHKSTSQMLCVYNCAYISVRLNALIPNVALHNSTAFCFPAYTVNKHTRYWQWGHKQIASLLKARGRSVWRMVTCSMLSSWIISWRVLPYAPAQPPSKLNFWEAYVRCDAWLYWDTCVWHAFTQAASPKPLYYKHTHSLFS